MKFSHLLLSLVILSPVLGVAQSKSAASSLNAELKPAVSNITKYNASDTSILKIEMKNAFYDFSKKRLPYYKLSKTTDYFQKAVPSLVNTRVNVVNESQAAVIKKFYGSYLSNNFQLTAEASLCKRENLNHYKLVPFRLNSFNQVEELTAYDVNWQVMNNETVSAFKTTGTFTTSSVLANGTWYKIGVTQTGVHKLTKSFFTDAGINVSSIDPRKIRIYGNGGAMVPELNSAPRLDDLKENAIIVAGEADGSFDNSDYVLFYAKGTVDWQKNTTKGVKFKATTSLYSDTSFYFINFDLGNGKRMSTLANSTLGPNVSSNSYDYYNYHELNLSNFGTTGREFYGEYFDITTSYSFKFNDGDYVLNDSLISEVSLVAKCGDTTRFSVSCGSSYYYVTTRGLNLNDIHEDYAAPGVTTGYGLNTNPSEIILTVNKVTTKALGWLNKVTINTRRNLIMNGSQFCFRDTRVSAPGKVCRFTISNPGNGDVVLLNVTDPINPVIQETNRATSSLDFIATSDILNEYCAVPQNGFYTPTFVGNVPNQNLHGKSQADYVIVTHPLFIKEAMRLAAFHQQADGFTYAVATIDEIYNEFSSGKQDPAAIRDFIRMLYTRNIDAGKQVRYVLLMGDGSYINKNRNLVNNSNYIPTYESIESLSETTSVASDDFYGMMDDNEGYDVVMSSGAIDIGVGRFTCRTVDEVSAVIGKIENYYKKDANFKMDGTESDVLSESSLGDWRNWLLFVGDDEDNALHMGQSDQLTTVVKSVSSNFNYDKIFLDSYQRYSTAGGGRYPDATIDFIKRVKKGALIFNYTGHGGEVGLTAERIVDVEIINSLDNFNRLPLFITATCEFSRYDDPSRTSAGELCLLNPKGAAIALYTTCRVAFSSVNMGLNTILLQNLFTKLPNGKWPTLGDVLQKTKAATGEPLVANFHLLGDPALTLAYPQKKVITSQINKKTVATNSSDTLNALAKITISGFVADTNGNKMTGFNGIIYPTVFDKEQTITCLINEPSSALISNNDSLPPQPFQFKSQKNILYRGKSQVTNGEFTFSFLVPKDISFAPGPGKISYYATNGVIDAGGTYSRVVVGGISKNSLVDNDGPQVDLYLNDKNFVSGGITNEDPLLLVNLIDSSGINTVGTGIGHDISVILDQNTSKPVILNDYYEANLNSYQSGKVRYPFSKLTDGTHRLSFKVWDIQNNSTTVNSDFIVAKSEALALQHVLNYPNPFTTSTRFIFQHNQGCAPLKVVVQVYTISGKLVKTIQKSVSCNSDNGDGVEWDAKDDYGSKLARGVYIYKLAIMDSENKKAEKIEKLVILN